MEVVISGPRGENAATLEEDANHVRVCKIRWRRQRERVGMYPGKVGKSMCSTNDRGSDEIMRQPARQSTACVHSKRIERG